MNSTIATRCQRDGEQAEPASPTEGRERPLGREYERSQTSKGMPVRIWSRARRDTLEKQLPDLDGRHALGFEVSANAGEHRLHYANQTDHSGRMRGLFMLYPSADTSDLIVSQKLVACISRECWILSTTVPLGRRDRDEQ